MIIKNIYAQTDTKSNGEIIEDIYSADSFSIERIISKGYPTPENEWYDQDTDEWVLLLKGKATILFKDVSVNLSSGDYLLIDKHEKHRVEKVSQDAVWLCIHFK